jgi:hypothetical protein
MTAGYHSLDGPMTRAVTSGRGATKVEASDGWAGRARSFAEFVLGGQSGILRCALQKFDA